VGRRGHFGDVFHKSNQKVGAGCGAGSESFPRGQALEQDWREERLCSAERGLEPTAALQPGLDPGPFTPRSQRT